jgi:hypothetical protein
MKKIILLAGCFSLFAVAAIGISCSKDEEWKGCKCTYTYDGEKETDSATAEELKEEDITSCAELKRYLIEYNFYEKVSCSDL